MQNGEYSAGGKCGYCLSFTPVTSVMVWMHKSASATLQKFTASIQMYTCNVWNFSFVENSLFKAAIEVFTLREVWQKVLDWCDLTSVSHESS